MRSSFYTWVAVLCLAGCSGADNNGGSNNGGSNNGGSNNGGSNNGGTNNGGTNNGGTNNGGSNNGGTNNGGTNNGVELPPSPCRSETDIDTDGTVDFSTDMELDAAGRIVLQTSYTGMNPSNVLRMEYSPSGQLAKRERDNAADGTFEVVELWTYDDLDRILTYSYADSTTPDLDYEDTYSYEGMTTTVRRDAGRDGTVDVVETYTYDADGNLVEHRFGGDEDGQFDGVVVYAYDGEGRIESRTRTLTGEVDPSELVVWNYTADGYTVDGDNPYDGTIDYRETYTLDSEGRTTRYSFDLGADGEDNISMYTYDEEGRLSVLEYDRDADGTVDDTTTWFYDC